MPSPHQITLYNGPSLRSSSIFASFDVKGRLVINKGDLDDDFYIHIPKGELAALKRVLDRNAKPRAKTGDEQRDILTMLQTLFADDSSAFHKIQNFLDENGIKSDYSHWIGADRD